MQYQFTLKFRLPASDGDYTELAKRISDAGCGNALVVDFGKPGYLTMEFLREAISAEAALTRALTDMRQAIPDGILTEIRTGQGWLLESDI
jgi:hypothetical protein